MKTTFKKTLAVVSAAAVVAASAVVMSAPASATAGGSISIGSTTVAYEDLTDGYEVEVAVSADSTSALAFGFQVSSGLTYSGVSADCELKTVAAGASFYWYAATSSSGTSCAPVLKFTIDKSVVDAAVDAASGVTDSNTIELPIVAVGADANGNSAANDGSDAAVSSGSVIIELPVEETTTTTTEAEEEETTTTTTATVTTSTGSPATGESSPLPIAGVVVAVAVIGGVAVVSKKRK